jgi:pimeloyl-ACP methyl ester carboxylesterase
MSDARSDMPASPDELASLDGLAYSLWLQEPSGHAGATNGAGVVILHGAGSNKENHYDSAAVLRAAGLAVLCFDARGHGDSTGPLDDRVVDDVVTMVELLRARLSSPKAAIGLRGSSMGGYLAIVAAGPAHADAVVAICPAGADGLRRGLASGEFELEADGPALDSFLASHPLADAVAALTKPMLILHAEGDERVPVAQSRGFEPLLSDPDSRLVVVEGGHHRSIQHDPELQALSARFLVAALGR